MAIAEAIAGTAAASGTVTNSIAVSPSGGGCRDATAGADSATTSTINDGDGTVESTRNSGGSASAGGRGGNVARRYTFVPHLYVFYSGLCQVYRRLCKAPST